MCGIAGIISTNHDLLSTERVQSALDSMKQRGPDQEGLIAHGDWVFGHKRLAILDVTESGRQPMQSPDRRFTITFNGEIYNYQELKAQLSSGDPWRSASDTEVILRAYEKWGEAFVPRLRGMFSIAIWDEEKKTLFAARDRLGEKPFYYALNDKCFAFASRPRGIFSMLPELSREYDAQGLRDFLEIGYFGREHSYYKHLHKLLPGHTLTYANGKVTTKPYWTFSGLDRDYETEKLSESELLIRLDSLLTEAVKGCLVSDVPVGCFLSGGIDSSLVAAIMRKVCNAPIKTFNIGFAEKECDESSYANAVAKHLKTDHFTEILKVDDLLGLFPNFIEEFDEPFFDHSAFPTMAVARLARKHVTVVLTGDGGDEVFGGYHYYQIINRVSPLLNLSHPLRAVLGKVLSTLPQQKIRALGGVLDKDSAEAMFAYSRSLLKTANGILSPEFVVSTQSISERFEEFKKQFPENLSASDRSMRLDLLFTLPDDYLQKVDQSTMAFSVESRTPFLDHRVVEWGVRLGHMLKLRGDQNKYLLRKLTYQYIPQEIMDRPKRGFGVPMSRWLRGPLREWAEERIYDEAAFNKLPLVRSRCQELWKRHIQGTSDHHSILWAILVLIEFQTREQKRFEVARKIDRGVIHGMA